MENNINTKKITKIFISLTKEKLWLEDMALNGWMLTNIFMGMRYTFKKIEPKHILFEIDRFNLPKNPALKEVRHKQEFLEMADEMGWKVVTHDEDLNYYFYKEYIEGDINELYNDEESRLIHATKYKEHYADVSKIMLNCLLFVSIVGTISLIFDKDDLMFCIFVFVLIYAMFIAIILKVYFYIGDMYYKEFLLSRSEWEKYAGDNGTIVKWKLNLTNRGVNKFLTKQAKAGYELIKMSALRYTFKKTKPFECVYTMDTSSLTNKRRKKSGKRRFEDSKDWMGMNNDWQVDSLRSAEENNWQFVCALENRAVIYRKVKVEENDEFDINKLGIRFYSIIGGIGTIAVIGGVCGGIAGFIFALLEF